MSGSPRIKRKRNKLWTYPVRLNNTSHKRFSRIMRRWKTILVCSGHSSATWTPKVSSKTRWKRWRHNSQLSTSVMTKRVYYLMKKFKMSSLNLNSLALRVVMKNLLLLSTVSFNCLMKMVTNLLALMSLFCSLPKKSMFSRKKTIKKCLTYLIKNNKVSSL